MKILAYRRTVLGAWEQILLPVLDGEMCDIFGISLTPTDDIVVINNHENIVTKKYTMYNGVDVMIPME